MPDENAGDKVSIRQHSQEYGYFSDSHQLSLHGMHWQEREDDDVPWLQPHVPTNDQKLIPARVSGGETRSLPLTEHETNMKDDLSKLLRNWEPELPNPLIFAETSGAGSN